MYIYNRQFLLSFTAQGQVGKQALRQPQLVARQLLKMKTKKVVGTAMSQCVPRLSLICKEGGSHWLASPTHGTWIETFLKILGAHGIPWM